MTIATQSIALAALQGVSELFPISSLGHAILVPRLLGWQLDENAASFLPFLVMLHLGTAVALLVYFRRDWWALGTAVLGLGEPARVRGSRRDLLLLVVATLPAIVIGGGLEHLLRRAFGSPLLVAGFLALNGLVLLAGERLRSRRPAAAGHKPLGAFTVTDALVIGLWQCLALLPGLSRSGATIIGGLLRGADHENAARFSFLLALPIIVAATALEIPKLFHQHVPSAALGLFMVCAVVSGLVAFVSTALLMRFFRRHDDWSLVPFALYCLVAGIGSAIVLLATGA